MALECCRSRIFSVILCLFFALPKNQWRRHIRINQDEGITGNNIAIAGAITLNYNKGIR